MKSKEILELNKNIKVLFGDSFNEIYIKFRLDLLVDLPQHMSRIGVDLKDNPGVYLLIEGDKFYIGETEDINRRISEHNEIRDVSFATFMVNGRKMERFEKTDVKDIESLIMEKAKEIGIKLTNKKNEYRKRKHGLILKRKSEENASRVWENFMLLNMTEIIDRYESSSLMLDGGAPTSDISYDISKKENKNNSYSELVTKNFSSEPKFVDAQIFNFIDRISTVPAGYIGNKRVFRIELYEDALYRFLYLDQTASFIESELISGFKSPKGFVVAYMLLDSGITTRGAKGSLFKAGVSSEKSLMLIEELVSKLKIA